MLRRILFHCYIYVVCFCIYKCVSHMAVSFNVFVWLIAAIIKNQKEKKKKYETCSEYFYELLPKNICYIICCRKKKLNDESLLKLFILSTLFYIFYIYFSTFWLCKCVGKFIFCWVFHANLFSTIFFLLPLCETRNAKRNCKTFHTVYKKKSVNQISIL